MAGKLCIPNTVGARLSKVTLELERLASDFCKTLIKPEKGLHGNFLVSKNSAESLLPGVVVGVRREST